MKSTAANFRPFHCAQAMPGFNKDTRHCATSKNYQTFADVLEPKRMEIEAIKRQLVMCGLVERRTIDPPVLSGAVGRRYCGGSGSEGDHFSSLSAYWSSRRCVQHRLLGIIVQEGENCPLTGHPCSHRYVPVYIIWIMTL